MTIFELEKLKYGDMAQEIELMQNQFRHFFGLDEYEVQLLTNDFLNRFLYGTHIITPDVNKAMAKMADVIDKKGYPPVPPFPLYK